MRAAAAGVLALLAALAPAGPAAAMGTVRLFADGDYSVRLSTLKELRNQWAFRSTVHQQYDFSCGSAAVATLLTYQYGHPVTEAEVFRVMFQHGDQPKIRRYGFSLLDMKRYLATVGFDADGFEVNLDKLAQVHVPAIALVQENGYNHFVVVKGLRGDKVLLSDPSSGGRIVTREEFDAIWREKILFVVRNHTNLARFDVPDQWRVRLPAPLSAESLNRSGLADPTLMMHGPNDF
jgi:predicted double-glycine peptidase